MKVNFETVVKGKKGVHRRRKYVRTGGDTNSEKRMIRKSSSRDIRRVYSR